MKVKYRTIVDDVNEIISDARSEKRTITEIQLTWEEWAEFVHNIDILARGADRNEVILYEGVNIVRMNS